MWAEGRLLAEIKVAGMGFVSLIIGRSDRAKCGMRQFHGHSMWAGGMPGWQSDQLDLMKWSPK